MKRIIVYALILCLIGTIIVNMDSSAISASTSVESADSEIKNDYPITTEQLYEYDKAKAEELGIVIGNGVKISEVYDGVHDIIATEEDFITEEAFREYPRCT